MKKILAVLLTVFLFGCSATTGQNTQKVRVGISWAIDIKDAAEDEDMQAYFQAIQTAGGEAVFMQQIHDRADALQALAEVDCVVLAGGEDISPVYYGQELSAKTEDVNEARDTSDYWLIKTAIEVDKPLLATCRGMQFLNVVMGGTLYQDIPGEYRTEIVHRDPQLQDFTYHTVRIEEGNILADAMPEGAGEYTVNSWHHQGIDKVGEGLKVVATAPDGMVEGIVCEKASYIYGVQFHPEWHVVEGTLDCLSVFQALMKAAKQQ